MNHLVYCIHFPCGRRYFGLTNDLDRRKRLHFQKARNGTSWRVCEALRECNYDVTWEVMQDDLTLEEASDLEISLISEHRTQSLKYGFNMTPGGHEKSGPLTEEHKDKIRGSCGAVPVVAVDSGTGEVVGKWPSMAAAANDLDLNPASVRQSLSDHQQYRSGPYCFGKDMEQALANRQAHIERSVRIANRRIEKQANKGMPRPKISEETRQKRSESVRKAMATEAYKDKLREQGTEFWVYVVGTGELVGRYSYIPDAAADCGLPRSTIDYALEERRAGRAVVFGGRYLLRYDDDQGEEAKQAKPYRRTFNVIQNGEIIANYRSAKKAEADYHVAAKTIRNCLRTGEADRAGRIYSWTT